MATSNLESAVKNADVVIGAIPTANLKQYLNMISSLPFGQYVNASKGVIDLNPVFKYFNQVMPDTPYATLSGPNIAAGIAENFLPGKTIPAPACATLAYDPDNSIPDLLQTMVALPYFRVYPHRSVDGVERCGMLKQIYAMALGVGDELKEMGVLNENTIAGMMQSCTREISRILNYHGIDPAVFSHTDAGIGDLYVTFRLGRNGKTGRFIARGGIDYAKEQMQNECVEGFRVLDAVYEEMKDTGIHLPIMTQMHRTVHKEVNLEQAMQEIFYNSVNFMKKMDVRGY